VAFLCTEYDKAHYFIRTLRERGRAEGPIKDMRLSPEAKIGKKKYINEEKQKSYKSVIKTIKELKPGKSVEFDLDYIYGKLKWKVERVSGKYSLKKVIKLFGPASIFPDSSSPEEVANRIFNSLWCLNYNKEGGGGAWKPRTGTRFPRYPKDLSSLKTETGKLALLEILLHSRTSEDRYKYYSAFKDPRAKVSSKDLELCLELILKIQDKVDDRLVSIFNQKLKKLSLDSPEGNLSENEQFWWKGNNSVYAYLVQYKPASSVKPVIEFHQALCKKDKLEDSDLQLKRKISSLLLGAIGCKEASTYLLKMSQNEDSRVRLHIPSALALLESEEVRKRLKKMAGSDKDKVVRNEAQEALERLKTDLEPDPDSGVPMFMR